MKKTKKKTDSKKTAPTKKKSVSVNAAAKELGLAPRTVRDYLKGELGGDGKAVLEGFLEEGRWRVYWSSVRRFKARAVGRPRADQ